MDHFANTYTNCSLCLRAIYCENVTFIHGSVKEVTDVLLLNLNVKENDKHVMCGTCSDKLFAAFHFKVKCVDTEDLLFPYVNSEKEPLIDLKEIYYKEKAIKHSNYKIGGKICRLCMEIIYEYISIPDVDVDIILKYIPEVDFSCTVDPVICRQCFDALRTHGAFLINCSKVKGNSNDVCEDNVTELSCNIKVDEIEIKMDENNVESNQLHFFGVHGTDITKSRSKMNFPKDSKRKYKKCIKNHQLPSQNFSEKKYPNGSSLTQMLKGDVCNYTSNLGAELRRHQLEHKEPSQVRMYKSGVCDYETKHKPILKRHLLIHKDGPQVCGYETRKKGKLINHRLMRKDPSQVQTYKCDVCGYQAKYKSYIKRHIWIHQDRSRVKKFKCDTCNLEFMTKGSLKKHHLRHKDPSQVQMYRCDTCNFESMIKGTLKRHQLRHKEPSQIQMHKCDTCGFETKHKSTLIRHQLVHKDSSEVQMYKCYTCGFETKRKGALIKHQLVHKDPSEVQMDKCDVWL